MVRAARPATGRTARGAAGASGARTAGAGRRATRQAASGAETTSARQTRSATKSRSTSGKKKQLGRGKRFSTGVDIGHYSVKIITLAGDDSGEIEIRNITVVPLAKPEGAEYPEELQNRQRDALKEAVKLHGRLHGRVVLGFPRELSVVRYLTLPSTDPVELQDMVYFDAERHVPFPIDDMELSVQVIEELGEHESKVILAAVPTKELHPYIQMCEEAGVDVNAVDLDVLADSAAYIRSLNPEETVGVVNFGRSAINFSIIRDNTLLFSRSLPVQESRLLAGFTGAKSWKDLQGRVTAAGALNPKEREHFSQWVEQLSMELMRSISAFACEYPNSKLNRMVLCGAAGYFPAGPLRGLDVRVKTAITIENALNGEIPSSDQYHGSELVTPVGLALRGLQPANRTLNLLPEELVKDRERKQRSAFNKNVMIFLFMIALLLGGGLYLKWYDQYDNYRTVDDFFMQLNQETAKISAMSKKNRTVETYIDKQQSCINVIQKVLEAMPPQTYISSMNFTKRKHFEIMGQVPNQEDVNKITAILINLSPGPDKEKFFDTVFPHNTAPRELDLDSQKMQVYEFRINCSLRVSQLDANKRG